MKFLSILLTPVVTLLSPALSQNAESNFWQDIAEATISNRSNREIVPDRYRVLSLSTETLLRSLSIAPLEFGPFEKNAIVIDLPLPRGTSERFRVLESPIMAPELAAKYPEIRTYIGQGIDDPRSTVRMDWTPYGFHAIIFTSNGTIYIDPYNRSTASHYISYYKHDLRQTLDRTMEEMGPLDTESETAQEIRGLVASGAPQSVAIGEELRTYRLALAATGEYTAFHGGTVALGMAAIVTAMNRVDGIYEREVAVRMVLIANNDTLVYTNASTDPYTNNNGGTMLGQNQSTLDNIIGNANYDVGHVFSTGGGGIANLGVPCRAGFKARGVTGLSSPIGDPFYVDYVAHEMGHQFGSNHTFNGNTGSCGGGNRNASTAYEPGSGTTIMAYAGICGSQNTQNQSDDYFHSISIDEIVSYTQFGSGNSCPVTTTTGNNAPTVSAGSTVYTIPTITPFFLTGSASDPNGDSLTYCWEEFDLGPAGHPNTPTGNAPIFRTFDPTSSPTRFFPRLSNILSGTQTIGEILPSYARTLNFRLTARDNRAGGGGSGKGSISVNVSDAAGPFQVTYPNSAIAWLANSTDSVTWNVANTNGSPVNCSNVNILLSTDGGQTFPTVLASNTPNDGSEIISVPGTVVNNARVKVEAVGNIFFDIGNADFSISSIAAPSLLSPPNGTPNQPLSLDIAWNSVTSATSYHAQVSRLPSFLILVVVNDSTLTDTVKNVTGLEQGFTYYWRVRAKDSSGQSIWSPVWSFATTSLPASVALVSPANQAMISTDSVAFRWNWQSVIERYWLEYGTDSTFTSSTIDSTLTDTSIVAYSLVNNQTYFWRARGQNSIGWGPYSGTRSFFILVTSVVEGVGIPEQFSLEQNFPNPFNPTTTIRYALPRQSPVVLEVFNMIGQRVAILFSGEIQEAGFHRVVFNSSGLSSGIYLYRLTATDFVATKKLTLMK
ncbi:MAG TPA: zinc-dependent metalloprotease family protein [Bacteroidota bacterium]